MVETAFKFDPVFTLLESGDEAVVLGVPLQVLADLPDGAALREARALSASRMRRSAQGDAVGSVKAVDAAAVAGRILPGSGDVAFGRQPDNVGETDERPVRTPAPYRQKQRVILVDEYAMNIRDKPLTRFGRRGQRNRLAGLICLNSPSQSARTDLRLWPAAFAIWHR